MPDVNLTGPIVGHPLDIATQEAQQQQANAIALEFIKQGMGQGSPVIHTGGNNPFARDVANWAGPIGNLAMALAGQKKLGDVQEAQQATAQAYTEGLGKERGDLLNSMTPHEVPGSTNIPGATSFDMHTPDRNEIISGLLKASTSQYAPIANAAKDMMGGLAKMTMTGADIARVLGSGNYDPASINKAFINTPLGMLPGDLAQLSMTKKPVTGPGGQVGGFSPVPGTVASAGPPLQPPKQPILPAFSPGTPATAGTPAVPANPLPQAATYTPEGVPEVVKGVNETPQAKTFTDIAKDKSEILGKGQQDAQIFAQTAPIIRQMVDLVPTARMGGGQAALITKAQQVLIAAGLDADAAGHVKDQATLMKFATPQGFGMARGLTSRPAVVEVVGSLLASAADPSVDPNAAQNVYRSFLTKGMNAMEVHNQNIAQFGKLPEIGPERAASFTAHNTPQEVLDSVKADAEDKSQYEQFQRNPTTGMWQDNRIMSKNPADRVGAPPKLKPIYVDEHGKIIDQ